MTRLRKLVDFCTVLPVIVTYLVSEKVSLQLNDVEAVVETSKLNELPSELISLSAGTEKTHHGSQSLTRSKLKKRTWLLDNARAQRIVTVSTSDFP